MVWRPGSTSRTTTLEKLNLSFSHKASGQQLADCVLQLEQTLPSVSLQTLKQRNKTPSVEFLSQFKLQVDKLMAFHYNTIYIVSDFSAFGIWDGNVTIYITESFQDVADTLEALQELLQVPISPPVFQRYRFFSSSFLNHRQLHKQQEPD